MINRRFRNFSFLALLAIATLAAAAAVSAKAADNASQSATSTQQTAVFAGGCFWGVDAVFKHVKGVSRVVSGYAGGGASTAEYEVVSTGTTGHAESVEVTYDPSQVSYGDLLKVFFYAAHDPTELNRQGPDSGTQYRSAIFFTNAAQKKIADDYIAQLDHAKTFPEPIVTQVVPLKGFYPAEAYHQNYLERHPDNPYIVINDLPKLDLLREKFPQLYKP
jgi:peptide-methionine (S)-S-oxide reductase